MMVTAGDAGLHARPMHVVERAPSGVVYLVSGADSAKVAEIVADSQMLLVFQDAR